jgi:hypothetical protein
MPDDKKESLLGRSRSVLIQCQTIVDRWAALPNDLRAVVIEQPQTFSAGMGGKRSAAHLPSYGYCVGAVTCGIRLYDGCELLTPSASDWTRGWPGTKGDPQKRKRVLMVNTLYGIDLDTQFSKEGAAGIADAVLLGRWAASRIRVGTGAGT